MKRKTSALIIILALLLSIVVIIPLARLVDANPYFQEAEFKEVTPPAGIEPPTISILTPENNTVYNSSDVSLTFDVGITLDINNDGIYDINDDKSLHDLDRVYYNSSWQSNVNNVSITRFTLEDNKLTSKYSIKIEGIPEGIQWLEIYAVGIGSYSTGHEIKGQTSITYFDRYKLAGSSMVNFTIDITPPSVSILSVENKTYYVPDVPLNFTVNEPVSQTSYSLDGQENVTIRGNVTLSGLFDGEHNVMAYATDMAGYVGVSETIVFTVAEEPEPFPAAPVLAVSAATLAIACIAILVYFKKR